MAAAHSLSALVVMIPEILDQVIRLLLECLLHFTYRFKTAAVALGNMSIWAKTGANIKSSSVIEGRSAWACVKRRRVRQSKVCHCYGLPFTTLGEVTPESRVSERAQTSP